MFSLPSARAAKGSPCTDDSPRNAPHQTGQERTNNQGVGAEVTVCEEGVSETDSDTIQHARPLHQRKTRKRC